MRQVVQRMIDRGGWNDKLALGRLKSGWPVVVGLQISSHCEPVKLADGVLLIKAESGVWASELALQRTRLRALTDDWLGGGIISEVKVWAGR